MWKHHPKCRIISVVIWKNCCATMVYRPELRQIFHSHRMPDVHRMHTDTHCQDQQNQSNYHVVGLDSNNCMVHRCPSHIWEKEMNHALNVWNDDDIMWPSMAFLSNLLFIAIWFLYKTEKVFDMFPLKIYLDQSTSLRLFDVFVDIFPNFYLTL